MVERGSRDWGAGQALKTLACSIAETGKSGVCLSCRTTQPELFVTGMKNNAASVNNLLFLSVCIYICLILIDRAQGKSHVLDEGLSPLWLCLARGCTAPQSCAVRTGAFIHRTFIYQGLHFPVGCALFRRHARRQG
jgi:hypothetical protein